MICSISPVMMFVLFVIIYKGMHCFFIYLDFSWKEVDKNELSKINYIIATDGIYLHRFT